MKRVAAVWHGTGIACCLLAGSLLAGEERSSDPWGAKALDVYSPTAVVAYAEQAVPAQQQWEPLGLGGWPAPMEPWDVMESLGVPRASCIYRTDSPAPPIQKLSPWPTVQDYYSFEGGDSWVGGNWEPNRAYDRAHLLSWLHARLRAQPLRNVLDKDTAGAGRVLANDMRLAYGVAIAYDPYLALLCAEAEIRCHVGSGRDVAESVWRYAWALARCGYTDRLQALRANPADYVASQYADVWKSCPALSSKMIGDLAPSDRWSRQAVLGDWAGVDATLQQIPEKQRMAISKALARRDKLGGGLSPADVDLVRDALADHRHIEGGLALPARKRWEHVPQAELLKGLRDSYRILGQENDLTADLALYLLEERKCTDYALRPQELLYVAVHVQRRYGSSEQRASNDPHIQVQANRAISLLAWVSKSGILSPATGPALKHDLFNAMEAPYYAICKFRTTRTNKAREVIALWRSLAGQSVKISWSPISRAARGSPNIRVTRDQVDSSQLH